jgi:translation initiation factor 3 subunit M
VNYIVRNQSDEERAAFIRPFQDVLKTAEGQKPLEQDEERRRKIFAMAIKEVKGFGDGNEKGVLFDCIFSEGHTERLTEIEGFFNLIYSHLFVLYPLGTQEVKTYLSSLLQTISSAPSDRSSIKYRMCANPNLSSLRILTCHVS